MRGNEAMLDTFHAMNDSLAASLLARMGLLAAYSLSNAAKQTSESLKWCGDLGIFCCKALLSALAPPYDVRGLCQQLDEIGSQSRPLIALAGAMVAIAFSLEAHYSLSRLGTKSLLPTAIAYSVIRPS
jgi:ABC-type transporter Mla maintaining outer membrane lipid asymmetry permease subunit MlaE